jgi:hypothetical protein
MLSLLAALWGGLVRMGWALPPLGSTLVLLHGPLMVSGFLGTLIGLERAAALGLGWAYAAPLLSGLSTLAIIAGLGTPAAALMTGGSLVLLALFVVLVRRQTELFMVTMAIATAAWVVGNALLLAGRPVYAVVPWWTGFLVLVIAGERQELTRLLAPPRAARIAFMVAVAVLLAGLAASTRDLAAGVRVAGLGTFALALWLGRYDMARRTIRQHGVARFMAASLLAGYAWLALGGLLALRLGGVAAGAHYDALLHSVFVGFVFSMIFGHAPVIFPGVLGLPIEFRPRFYVHLALLHLSLVVRIVGDLVPSPAAREWGGLLNVVAVLVFLANTISSVRRP